MCLKANLMISLLIYVMLLCAVLERCQEQSVPFNVLTLYIYLYKVLQESTSVYEVKSCRSV